MPLPAHQEPFPPGGTHPASVSGIGWWPERLASFAAAAGLTGAVLNGFHVRLRQNAASDFKTLYASAWCFARGRDAYSFSSLAGVFQANRVILPRSWYAHAPVYPPFTLALLAPLTAVPMVLAIFLWIALSAAVFACAAAALARTAGEDFQLSRPWRLLLIALAALLPLVSFSLELGNVSVVVAALCILAACAPPKANPWPSATMLTLALLLKPHLALWVWLALALRRSGQAIALLTAALCVAFLALIALWSATQPGHFAQLAGYRTMVAAELATGSMAAANREIIDIPAQITSLGSLLGFWLSYATARSFTIAVLALMAAFLLWASWRLRSAPRSVYLQILAAWCAFGLIATYHRAHDGMVLLVLLPATLARLRASWRDAVAWSTLLLLAALSTGPAPGILQRLALIPEAHAAAQFVLYRQSALAASLLAMLLLGITVQTARSDRVRSAAGGKVQASKLGSQKLDRGNLTATVRTLA